MEFTTVSETKFINLLLEIQGFHPICISYFSDSMVKPYGQSRQLIAERVYLGL